MLRIFFYFEIIMKSLFLFSFCLPSALLQTFPKQPPPNIIGSNLGGKIVHIFWKGHPLPSCFGTLLIRKRYVITSATCLLNLSDGMSSNTDPLVSSRTKGLSKIEVYSNLNK